MEGDPCARLRLENARLSRDVAELEVLNKAATELSQASSLKDGLKTLVEHSCRATGAEQGVIYLVDEHAPGADTPPTLVRVVATRDISESASLKRGRAKVSERH